MRGHYSIRTEALVSRHQIDNTPHLTVCIMKIQTNEMVNVIAILGAFEIYQISVQG